MKRSTRALVNVNAAVHAKEIMQIRAAEQSQATAPSEGQVVFSRLHGAGAAWFRGCLFPLFCRGWRHMTPPPHLKAQTRTRQPGHMDFNLHLPSTGPDALP